MAGQTTVNQIQLGDNATATQNFVLQTNSDGTATLARGNVGATTQDVLTIDGSGIVTATQGLVTGRMVLSTAQATTSGTSIDFTGIPSWVKRITVMLNGVSTNGTSLRQIQLGSGSIQVTGYVSAAGRGNSANGHVIATSTTGFNDASDAATFVTRGNIILVHMGGNLWSCSGSLTDAASLVSMTLGGNVTLTGTLDRLRLTTVNGTDTFDAGSVNIMYEG